MKDEIKEILDRAKNLKYKCDCCEEIAPGKYIMRNDKQTDNLIEAVYIIDKLLDYITNLQEEKIQLEGKIKQLEHNCKQASDSCRQHRLASKNHIRRLERREQQINIYKSRNEKAIEYMNNYIKVEESNEPVKIEFKVVRNILQGEDKDDK